MRIVNSKLQINKIIKKKVQHNFVNKYNFLSNKLNINTLIKRSGVNIIMPFYHTVSNKHLPHIKHLYSYRNTTEFENELEFYLKHFTPISLSDLINRNYKKDKNYFFLSLDDGLSEVYNIIAPILLKKGIPATFFVNTSFIDNKILFNRFKASLIFDAYLNKNKIKDNTVNNLDILNNKYTNTELDNLAEMFNVDFSNFLQKQKPYLTSEQINILIKQGFDIGSHSVNHIEYSNLNIEKQNIETIESVEFLKQNFNIKNTSFSFPFTDYGIDLKFFKQIKNSVDITFGTAGIKLDNAPHNYQRIPIEEFNINAEKIVKAEYLYFILSKFVGKHRINRK